MSFCLNDMETLSPVEALSRKIKHTQKFILVSYYKEKKTTIFKTFVQKMKSSKNRKMR